MSYDSSHSEAPVQKKKKGGCLMAALILAAIAIVGFIALMIAAKGWADKNITTDPVKAAAAAAEFADTSEWEGWETQLTMNAFIMKMAVMNAPETGGMAWFTDGKNEIIHDPSARTQVETQLRDQNGSGQFEKMTESSSSTEVVTVRGEEAEFTFKQGEGVESGKALIEVSGIFAGKTADRGTMLWLRVPAEQYPIEKIKEMLGQIR